MLKSNLQKGLLRSGVFAALVLAGLLTGARMRDPFSREWFNVPTASKQCPAVAVKPKGLGKLPVIIFAHGVGGNCIKDGSTLRQFAELGLAAVSFDYSENNSAAFGEEFASLLSILHHQPWVDTNSIAWVGCSLGSQNTLRYLLAHSQSKPQVFVGIAGGWMPELKDLKAAAKSFPKVLLVNGEDDETPPAEEAKSMAQRMRAMGVEISAHTLPNHGHTFEADRALVFRLVAEFCKAKLRPGLPSPPPIATSWSRLWLCLLPSFAWLLFCFMQLRKQTPYSTRPPVNRKIQLSLRITAICVAACALSITALHLVPPRMKVDALALSLTRKFVLDAEWSGDFESLVSQPVWNGQQVRTLLTHVELARYMANDIVDWKTDRALYTPFVLSPIITGHETELNWRRELWEVFYPRVRHEKSTETAAKIVVRFLRERITIQTDYPTQAGIVSMWNNGVVSEKDFQVLYVAALRSVAVPARLSENHQAEFWTGAEWQPAPPPLATSWIE